MQGRPDLAPYGLTLHARGRIGPVVVGYRIPALRIHNIGLVGRVIDGRDPIAATAARDDQRASPVALSVIDAGAADVPAANPDVASHVLVQALVSLDGCGE